MYELSMNIRIPTLIIMNTAHKGSLTINICMHECMRVCYTHHLTNKNALVLCYNTQPVLNTSITWVVGSVLTMLCGSNHLMNGGDSTEDDVV